ncbi:DNA polymerase elongation subunit (family B) [Halovivax ruber XH-70]|uniref:DNA-directed DNA polymerase n=1 Tax=Halovivax ruber (strain DSM 18193 / JCM 13892 / XH-70) TaxID=797302 RepID=L0ICW7_HALRX|nr:type B DNA-directed DNA polymerase [Halovivax ruber]AGB17390.1 DNA polymerase elongation subunit (family B) [Halovivax ruber XH-70]
MTAGLFKVDYLDGEVLKWHATSDGVETVSNTDFTPTIYAIPDGDHSFEELADRLDPHPLAMDMQLEPWRRGWRHDPEPVLRIDVPDIDAVDELASHLRDIGRPGDVKCFNVDFSREFRYCLETGQTPDPARDLRTLGLTAPATAMVDDVLSKLSVDGERVSGSPEAVVERVDRALGRIDPDVLILSSSELVPALYDAADVVGRDDFDLGRRSGWQTLAGASTFESYGQVGHSPARYNVPGRAIIDRSNTFFYDQSGLQGILDLSRRSGKPLQELAWASIGNVLTAIQITESRELDVLTPWKSWRHEFFKSMRTLHEADRGGYTFAPDVGVHEDVHELDFSSLYPNIIVTRNISPETICCDCHDSEDVPGLGYSICDERGYLADVLEPLISDRDAIKAEIRETDDEGRKQALQQKSDAIKWILVSCFGYQGFSNAKFGRIECHEAINAYAREILLNAKQTLEANGWRVVHGIVDSLWVQANDGMAQTALEAVAREIFADAGIRLEYEGGFDWVAFVPMADSKAGALTKYFGRKHDGEYKFRGIEVRQHSTPPYVADCQRELIEVYDSTRTPEAVCDRLDRQLQRLRSGEVNPMDLVIEVRSSKRLEEYTQSTRSVAALERAEAAGIGREPGQPVEYVVVDESKSGRERVQLPHEGIEEYDAAFYATEVIRAAESVLSPSGWREETIREYLADRVEPTIGAF